jgi:MFS family permease
LGVIAQVIGSQSFKSKFQPTGDEIGAVVSVFTGGAFFGAGLGGAMGDRLGRRWTIFFGALVFCLGGALQTGAQALSYLYAGRAIAGLGIGILVMIIPVYQGELAHPDIRGRITALQQFMLGVGALSAAWISYGMDSNYGHDDLVDSLQAHTSALIPPTAASGAPVLVSKSFLLSSLPRSFSCSRRVRDGSSIKAVSKKVFAISPNYTLMAMRTIPGFKPSFSRFKNNSPSSTNTKRSPTWSFSRTSPASAVSFSLAPCKPRCR